MAADDYYNGSLPDQYNEPTRQENHNSLPRPPSKKAPNFIYTHHPAVSPYSSNSPVSEYQSTERIPPNRDSSYYPTAAVGRLHDNDQYSDNIPLKPQLHQNPSQEDWTGENTKYPPSPESQRAGVLAPPLKSKKSRWFGARTPWFVYIVSIAQMGVFVGEIIKNATVTGSPIMIHPQFNPMIGPSTYVLINMGARFVPCMRTIPEVQHSTTPISWPCPNTTTSDPNAASNHCDLSVLCGFSGLNDSNPNQWFRFIVPMFLHAGIVHIGFNMLLQLTMGREMEFAIGSVRFALVYFSSGIFGFVLGGNYAATAIASTGASGCLFGILALALLDLLYCWNERQSPGRELMWIMLDILISFVLGLLPGLDNFSHIGGFLMGLVLGICILHSPNVLRQRIGLAPTPYEPMADRATAAGGEVGAFAKQPVGFFKGRKPLWWAWWLLRAGALIGVLISFLVLLDNFYKYRNTCSWCKYLSCLPINHWCDLGNLQLNNVTSKSSGSNRRGELLHMGTSRGGMGFNPSEWI